MLAPSSSRDANFSVLHFFPARHEYKLVVIFENMVHTLFLLCQDNSMAKSHQHGTFGIAYPQLAF